MATIKWIWACLDRPWIARALWAFLVWALIARAWDHNVWMVVVTAVGVIGQTAYLVVVERARLRADVERRFRAACEAGDLVVGRRFREEAAMAILEREATP